MEKRIFTEEKTGKKYLLKQVDFREGEVYVAPIVGFDCDGDEKVYKIFFGKVIILPKDSGDWEEVEITKNLCKEIMAMHRTKDQYLKVTKIK